MSKDIRRSYRTCRNSQIVVSNPYCFTDTIAPFAHLLRSTNLLLFGFLHIFNLLYLICTLLCSANFFSCVVFVIDVSACQILDAQGRIKRRFVYYHTISMRIQCLTSVCKCLLFSILLPFVFAQLHISMPITVTKVIQFSIKLNSHCYDIVFVALANAHITTQTGNIFAIWL